MCAVGFSPGTSLANALGHGVLGTARLRKRLRGVKSAKTPFEPTRNHGRTPPPWGEKYLDPLSIPSISRGTNIARGSVQRDMSLNEGVDVSGVSGQMVCPVW